jgi:hypothetical protein
MMNKEYADEVIEVMPPRCILCSTPPVAIPVRRVDYDNWRAGMNIQFAMPEMPADTREMLISGTHPACWDRLADEEES